MIGDRVPADPESRARESLAARLALVVASSPRAWTYRELAAAVDAPVTSTWAAVAELARAGLVAVEPRTPRSLRARCRSTRRFV